MLDINFRFPSVRTHQFSDRLHSSRATNVAPIKIGRNEVVLVLSLTNIFRQSIFALFAFLTPSALSDAMAIMNVRRQSIPYART